MQTKIQNLTAELQNAYKSMQTEIETLRQKNRELENKIKELKIRLADVETDENTKLLLTENQVFKNEANELRCEISRQIIEKNTYKKENKRLKKRRRSGRYEPKKVYEKLAKGRLCYIPEGDYLPTKVHESLIDATEEAHRLQHITGHTVYVMGTYCRI